MVIWDLSRNSVVVTAQKSAARLGLGDEVVITDHKPYYREIHQSDTVGRREINRFFVGNDTYMTTTEFALHHALGRAGLLYSRNAGDQAICGKVVKAKCILESIRHRRGPFETGEPLGSSFQLHDPIAANEDLLPAVKNHGLGARSMR